MKEIKEIRVRPVVRWIVTEFCKSDVASSCAVIGEFDNERQAEIVAHAIEHAPPYVTEVAPLPGLETYGAT
jgi:hypothetical protein